MGKGGSAAGGDGGGSGGGEGAAAVVGLDGLAIRFWPFFSIASDSTTCGDRWGEGVGTIPKGMINFLARLNFTPGKCYDAQTPNHMKKRYETKILWFDHPPLDTT